MKWAPPANHLRAGVCLGTLLAASAFSAPKAKLVPQVGGIAPELVLQVGHTSRLGALVFSPDSRLIASTGVTQVELEGDGTIKLWEVPSGRLLRTLGGHSTGVTALAFSHDGRWLASGGNDNVIKVWEVETGRQVRTFYVPRDGVEFLAFNHDASVLISSSYKPSSDVRHGRFRAPDPELSRCPGVHGKPGFCTSHDVTLWDLEAERELVSLSSPERPCLPSNPFQCRFPPVWRIAVSPDGRWLAAGFDGYSLKRWDATTGRPLATLEGAVSPFVISPDGLWMASSSKRKAIIAWDVARRRAMRVLPTSATPVAIGRDGRSLVLWNRWDSRSPSLWNEYERAEEDEGQVWDVATGREVRLLRDRSVSCANCRTSFSPDGEWMIRSGSEPKLALWSLGALRQRHTWAELTEPVALSPDGRWMAAAYRRDNIWFRELATARETCSRASPVARVRALAVGPGTHWLATGVGEHIQLWETTTGVPSKTLPGEGQIGGLAVSADGRLMASGQEVSHVFVTNLPAICSGASCQADPVRWDAPACPEPPHATPREEQLSSATVALWDVEGGSRVWGLPGGAWAPLAASRDKGLLATAGELGQAAVWNFDSTGSLRRRVGSTERGDLWAQSFSAGGDVLATAQSGDSAIQLWDVGSGRRRGELVVGHGGDVSALAFAPAGRLLASAGWGSVRLWSIDSMREVRALPGSATWIASLAFSPDGRTLAAGGDGVVERWEVETGRQLSPLLGHGGTVHAVAYSRDGLFLFSGSDDGTTRVWDSRTGALLATILSLHGGEDWLVVAPDGLFDGSPEGWNSILWRFGGKTFDVAPVEIFFKEYFHPGLLAEILAGGNPRASTSINSIDRRQPSVALSLPHAPPVGQPYASRALVVRIDVSERRPDSAHVTGSGVQDVRLFRNGSLVKLWREVTLDSSGGAWLETKVPIVAGENVFTAYAFSNSGIKSPDTSLTVTGAAGLRRKGTAYILTIGIDRYPGEPLKYAVADARYFAEQLGLQQTALQNYASVVTISLLNESASRATVVSALRRLAGLDSAATARDPSGLARIRRAEPEDAVFIYFAGHGVASPDGQRFYLLTQDFADAPNTELAASSGVISDLLLEEDLQVIDAGKIILVVDACQSGRMVEVGDPRQGPMNSQGLAQLAYEKGMYILAASQGDQFANELDTLRHGLLTYALVEEGLAEDSADFEPRDGRILLREWLDYAVTRVPHLQLAFMRRAARSGRGIAVVKGEESRAVEDRSLQRPRVFYRREREIEPLVIAGGSVVR